MSTNNSINTPKPIDVSSGGTGLSTATTAYGVIAAGTTTTGAFQNIGTGASGEVLTSNGAGALPTFQAAAGGSDVVLLSSQGMNGVNSLTFNSFVDNTVYNSYEVVMWGTTTAQNYIYGQISTDNGVTFISSGYAYVLGEFNTGVSPAFFTSLVSASASEVTFGIMYANSIASFRLNFMPFGEAVETGGQGMMDYQYLTLNKQIMWPSWYSATTNANAFKIYTQNGTNWTSGTACLYGYKK